MRYDLSVEQTAEILGCATGTVKTQTARGLADLRAFPTGPGATSFLVRGPAVA